MRILPFLLCLLFPLLTTGQAADKRILLVEHNNFKKQFYFAEGNKITFFTRQGEKANGILAELTDSTVRVDNISYKVDDIARIKRRTASTFSKVVGGVFIFGGVIILGAVVAADPSGAEGAVLAGLATVAIGIPLVAEPSFEVGENCRLLVATYAANSKRR